MPKDPRADGALALDLVDTARLSRGRRVDHLATPGDARTWLQAAGLLVGGDRHAALSSAAVARIVHDEALRLRSALRTLFRAHADGVAPGAEALHALDRVLAHGRTRTRLEASEGGLALEEVEVGEGPLSLLAPIARSAARLVTTAAPGRLRACAAEGCPRWFLDTSRGGRRRWCDMSTCGNRRKAARHRRARAAGR